MGQYMSHHGLTITLPYCEYSETKLVANDNEEEQRFEHQYTIKQIAYCSFGSIQLPLSVQSETWLKTALI